jgi:hypothetical protein
LSTNQTIALDQPKKTHKKITKPKNTKKYPPGNRLFPVHLLRLYQKKMNSNQNFTFPVSIQMNSKNLKRKRTDDDFHPVKKHKTHHHDPQEALRKQLLSLLELCVEFIDSA